MNSYLICYTEAKDANRVDKDTKPVEPGERSILELDLKLQHRELNRDFQRLSSKTIPDEHRGDFIEPRIINLWREAKFSNFTEEELESLRVSFYSSDESHSPFKRPLFIFLTVVFFSAFEVIYFLFHFRMN